MDKQSLIKELQDKIESLIKAVNFQKEMTLSYKEICDLRKERCEILEQENKKLILFRNISFN